MKILGMLIFSLCLSLGALVTRAEDAADIPGATEAGSADVQRTQGKCNCTTDTRLATDVPDDDSQRAQHDLDMKDGEKIIPGSGGVIDESGDKK